REGEVDQVRAVEVSPRTRITERRCPRDDQGRTLAPERVHAQAETVQLSPRRRLQQDVGAGYQRAESVAVVPLVEVEHDRALPPVVLPEEQGALGTFAILVERTDASRGAATGRLHLDDVGA